jgi:hypothetical protein
VHLARTVVTVLSLGVASACSSAAESELVAPDAGHPDASGDANDAASTDGWALDTLGVGDSPRASETLPDGAVIGTLPDGAQVLCCALGTPMCECTQRGGSPERSGACVPVCDAPADAFRKRIDANGCPYWDTTGSSDSGCTPDLR